MNEHRLPGSVKAPDSPSPAPFPGLDDHLVEPEVTRDEMVGGVRVVASPVEVPHATQQSQLNYLVRAHAIPGYRVAMELLTRFDEDSDFATDVCVIKEGLDPATGHRYLEEVAFEVMFEQSEDLVKEKAVRMHRRGVRRIFTIWCEDQKVCEWSPEIQDWCPLKAKAPIEDPCFTIPLDTAALFDDEAADNAVARALIAKQTADGWARGRAEDVLDVLETRGTAVSSAQRQEILSCRDLARLSRWLRRAVLASSADEVLAEG